MRAIAVASLLSLGLGCTTQPADAPRAAAPAVAPVETSQAATPATREIRWVALGDSYSKGEAARREEAWPYVAALRLHARWPGLKLVANLGVTGWTTRDVLVRQVPWLDTHAAELVTVQVGINDLVQGVDEDSFRTSFQKLLGEVIRRTRSADRVVAVTIPDFSVARMAPEFGDPTQIHADIERRNAIIKEEGAHAGVRVADIFARSRDAAKDPSLLAADGIHPSAKGYLAWVDDVLPVVEAALATE